MKTRKSWNEKLVDNKGLPKISKIEGKMTKRWGAGTMLIPAPLEVKELMDRVPKGKLVTINELRGALAKHHQTTIACPITTGIFAWIAAHAAEESAARGSRTNHPVLADLEERGRIESEIPGRN